MKLHKDRQKFINWLSIAIIAILLLALFLVGTFLDLQIARKVGNPNSFFGVFFDWFGKIIYSLPLFIGIVLTIKSLKEHFNKKIKKFIEYSIYFGFWAIVMTIFLAEGLNKYLNNSVIDDGIIISLVLNSALVSLIFLGVVLYVDTDPEWIIEDRRLIRHVILMIIFIVIVNLSVLILKEIFARPRPQTIFAENSLEEYRPWWKIRYTGKNRSFPSGHVAAASTMLGLTILFDKEDSKGKYLIAHLVGWICILLVGFSRMIMTAHFLSDVVAATIIAFVTLVGVTSLRNKQCKFKCFKLPAKEEKNG
ncbi:phosphatase PAP2 family protein [Mesoplasma syrphidae]|uniref:Phosphatase PAP2 family protein n=1 Tax=Mesoplasma syrphidae TaxID=225999 RepID=A0A2K9C639_9MOLU|nr:phosphatase PAP2 family protein [Mesoplasma syrphidae]AUF83757.1 phosphatase PAP2 family protein [Mesoplasma syrphidae]